MRALAEYDTPQAYRLALALQAAPAGASGADRTRALNVLARAELYLARTDEAGAHAERALAQAKAEGDRVGQAEADLVIAMNAVNQGRIDRLAEATTHSLKVLEGVPRPDLLAESMVRTAMMYNRLGKLDESVAICVQSLEIARLSQVPLALVYGHQCMAISYWQSEHHREALEHYQSMRKAARAAGSRLLEADAMASVGGTMANLGERRDGELLVRQAVEVYREIGVPFYLSSALFGLANTLAVQGRHAEVVRLLDEVEAIYQRHPNRIAQWWLLSFRSAEYEILRNPAAAASDAEHAYRVAQDLGLALYLGNSTRRLAALAAKGGDYRRAYAYAHQAAELAAKNNRDKASARVLELTQRYESEGQRRRIEELTRNNARQQAELQQRALEQRWLWTVLGGGGLLLLTIAGFLFRLRRSHGVIRALNTGLERKVQERTAALRQQSRYLRVLIDTLPWWVWFKDTGSRYLAVNRAVADTWERGVEAMVGLTDRDVAPAMAERFENDDREVMAARAPRMVEEQQMTANGPVWVEIYKAPVLDEDGSVLGTVGFARDISERKLAEGAREAALVEAQRLAQLRSEFLAQMSHELRTPLNGILGYAQILQRDAGLNARQLGGVDVIQRSGDHLLTLINDLLDSAKIEASKLELQVAALPLRECLRTIAEMVRVKAEQKELAFSCEIGDEVPAMVQGDERRLRQALLNLLANAVKFTDQGAVSLRVGAGQPGLLRFEVVDTGVGIAASQLERIFEPFEQVGEARLRHGGTGLGLAISRQFVRLLGGDIAVESQAGRGCRFWFELSLPALELTPPEHGARRQVAGYGGARRAILVLERQAANRRLLTDMLAPLGFAVAEAANVDAALALAQQQAPDLVLLDLAMLGGGGPDPLRRMRGLPGLARLPAIVLSDSGGGADGEPAGAAAPCAVLARPIDLTQLLERIGGLLALEWRWQAVPSASAAAERDADGPADAPLLAPPPDEMAHLHHLAKVGNMRAILRRAGHIEALDPCYRPFAARLRRLAEGYQSQALLRLVEQHMGTAARPARDSADNDAKTTL